MTTATYARSDESRAVAAVLRHAARNVQGEHRSSAEEASAVEVDDADLVGLLIAHEHGIDAARLAAYRSLGRSRGLPLGDVLRAAFRGELRDVVALPVVEGRRRGPAA